MARKYSRIKQYETEIMEMHRAGKSHREIGEALRLSRDQIKEFLRRPRRKVQKIPQKKGRPSKNPPTTWAAMEKENARLRMENELLRDFRKALGRM